MSSSSAPRSARPWAAAAAAAAFAVIGALAPPALAHDTTAAAGHAAEDDVALTAAQERALQADSRADTRAASERAAAATDGPPQVTGTWGPLQPLPGVTIHEALLPDGRIFAYDSAGDKDQATEKYPDAEQNHTRAFLWDPQTGASQRIDLDGSNIFCSGLAHLVDGTIFTAGGNKNHLLTGLNQTWVYNPALPQNNGFVRGQDMTSERWYPTVTELPDGRMLIAAGHNNGEAGDPSIPEVRATDGTVRQLPGARLVPDESPSHLVLDQYPWMDVAPDGSIFDSGPQPRMYRLDANGQGAVAPVGDRADGRNRRYGSRAAYEVGKVLVTGGGEPELGGASSTETVRVIDFTDPRNPVVTPANPMAFKRRQHNLTVLADGSVLATGGNSSGAEFVDKDAGVYAAERWDPVTGQWTTLASEQRTRQYHSAALLLPDGRVASSGGGLCQTCDDVGYLEKNGQVFTPPYLYDASGGPAPRPTITGAPAGVGYGAALDIGTPQSASIQKVALVRLGAVTHGNNMDQRYVPLSFSRNGGGVQATAPANANIAPPGVYMLFILDDHGVPSVSRMVSVGAGTADAAPAVALTQPAAGTVPSSFGVAATASDPDGSVAKVTFLVDGRAVAEDATAPYTAQVSGLAAGTHALTAVAVDGLGLSATSAPVTVTVPRPAGGPGGPGPGRHGSTATPRLTHLVVLGRTYRTRKLRVVASAKGHVLLRLARRRGAKLRFLPGRRTITLRKGVNVVALKEPWNGRRLARGRYVVVLGVGRRNVRASFAVS